MQDIKVYEDKMNKTLDNLAGEYGTIRAGRANPHVLDRIHSDSASRKRFRSGAKDAFNPALGQDTVKSY